LGHLTRKIPSPIWPIMCWWDIKPYSINQSPTLALKNWDCDAGPRMRLWLRLTVYWRIT